MNEIAIRLLEAYNRKGISYAELSEKTGIAKSALQRYITGATNKIPISRIETIAKALDVSAAYILGWEAEPEPMPEMPLGVAVRQQKHAAEPKQQPSIDELISQLQELKCQQSAGAYNLTQDEQELIDDYRTLTKPMKLKARRIIGALADRTEE